MQKEEYRNIKLTEEERHALIEALKSGKIDLNPPLIRILNKLVNPRKVKKRKPRTEVRKDERGEEEFSL